MIIAIDFDGTCVTHDWPQIGREIGATAVLKELSDAGHQLILFTMRSDETLADAVKWFKGRNIPLFGINTNPQQKRWTNSPKAYAQMYIDDAALGCPIIYDTRVHGRPYVDWGKVRTMLTDAKILPE